MVAARAVIESNACFASQKHEGIVCVFAGATSGIGARTLERMTTMFKAPTFYVLGRSSARFAKQRKTLESLNRDCKVIFIETEVALISGIDLASQQITAAETKIDYLCMSMGGIPMNGAEYTEEGLETNFAISYFSRMRLLSNLLPLLHQSPRPRVLSVLNGGKEKYIIENDLGLEKNWTIFNVVKHTTCLTSLAFDYLAANNTNVTFVHNYPGLVESDNFRRVNPPEGASLLHRIFLAAVKRLVALIRFFIGMTPNEAGERQVYHFTSDRYSPGAWRVHQNSEPLPATKALKHYEANGWPEKIWAFTISTWDKALAKSRGGAPDQA
ncbi:hypothetical protein DL770_008359 [Monosporascus sp. CRB-9-2]|nr:hypothetical protein DL770_008359 [Monosporascus sp. CRB-9-2]